MKDDGGPAFPISNPDSQMMGGWQGMTLRDYFAAHAPELPAEDIKTFRDSLPGYTSPVMVRVMLAYQYADCMIKYREAQE